MKYDYDLLIIGGGSAGLVGARIAAAMKAKVGIIEKNKLGGDCLEYGCVPSKALIAMHKIIHSPFLNVLGLEYKPYKIDFSKIAKDIQDTKDIVGEEDSEDTLKKIGINTIYGSASFIDKHTVEILHNNIKRKITSKSFLIATGSHPFVPKTIKGVEDIKYLTNENIFSLNKLPESLIVLGGGPIGCEMAQALALLGTKVTIVQRNKRLLPNDDEIASTFLLKKFQEQNIEVLLEEEIISVKMNSKDSTIVELKSRKKVTAQKILIAIGREANIDGMNLEGIGVSTTDKGIIVNDYLQTSIPNIYAAGDVTGQLLFTPFASFQGSSACANSLLPKLFRTKFGIKSTPWVTFTTPEIAHTGVTEEELKKLGIDYRKLYLPYSKIDRAITEKSQDGFIQVYINSKDSILGATIMGERAGDLIMEIVLAMNNGIRATNIIYSIHPYPTYSSGIQKIFYDNYLQTNSALKWARNIRKIFK